MINKTILYMNMLFGTLKVVASDTTPSDTTQKSQPWINEYTLSANYNDIARYQDYDNRGGFGLGIYHNSRVSKGFSTNIGLEYNLTRMYGARAINHLSTYAGRYSQMNFRWHTMTLPLSLRYHLGKRWMVFPEIGIHANMNMLLTQRGEFYTIPQFGPHEDNSETKDYYSSYPIRQFSIGAHAGIGVRIPLKENHLLIKAEYRYGFDKENNYNQYTTTFDGVLNYFRFSAGYSFGLRPNSPRSKEERNSTFFNEFLMSSNYVVYSQDNMHMQPDIQGAIGFGIALQHSSFSRKNFQYVFGLSADVLRSSNQYHIESQNILPEPEREIDIKAQSLNISILNGVRYYITSDKARFFLQAGVEPGFGFLERSRVSVTMSENSSSSNSESTDIDLEVRLTSFGPTAGAGCILKGNKCDYILSANYKWVGDLHYSYMSLNNSFIRLSAGIRLKGRD